MNMISRKWIMLFLPFLILGMFGLCACGSSDDDESDTGSGNFAPDTTSPGANAVYLELSSQDNNRLVLSVKAMDLSNVYGIWFNLDFDGQFFQFIEAGRGDFLGDSGSTSFFATGKSYTVVVGTSRQGEAAGASGSGTICTLTFEGLAEGSSRFDFSSNHAADPNGNKIPGLTWYGGTGTVVL